MNGVDIGINFKHPLPSQADPNTLTAEDGVALSTESGEPILTES